MKKKILAIGIIALFVGMVFIPMGASIKTQQQEKTEQVNSIENDYKEYKFPYVCVYGSVKDLTLIEYTKLNKWNFPIRNLLDLHTQSRYGDVHFKGTTYGYIAHWVYLPITWIELGNSEEVTIEIEYDLFFGSIDEYPDDVVGHVGTAFGVTVKIWR